MDHERRRGPIDPSFRAGAKSAVRLEGTKVATIWIEEPRGLREGEARAAGWVSALILGVGIPGLLLGPVFNGVHFAAIPFADKLAAALCALFGWWLAMVSHAADAQELEKVLGLLQLQGSELALLLLPFMLWIGTKSVLRRCGWL